MNKDIIDEYFKLQDDIFEAFGYIENYKEIQDLRLFEWSHDEENFYYSQHLMSTYKLGTCYSYSLDKNCFYESGDFVMIVCDPGFGTKCLVVVDKKKKRSIEDIS